MELVIASNNKNKIKEITQILGNFFEKLYSLQDLGINIDVAETGKTFYENALIKARTISELTQKAVIADDSGLEVYALNFEPGIYSARYASVNGEANSSDEKNNELLLKNMEKNSNRKARFVSSVVLYYPSGRIIATNGITEGEILYEKKGANGFGYDPLFYSYELNKSFGESTAKEKNLVSHRAKALAQLKDILSLEKNM
ncbi:MAG: RdgB/HAM1 family non-canonical purine NTP pyrophosphatase [Clostridiales bacterium]|mgnify:CR=1 FL=1|nr:RdgB/HAM1 family non-canonical purine NTP pyrophosphatase [Clostridiales bacterium]